MRVYTRQGDQGQTSLGDGRRVLKNDPRIETCGTIDELNSALGVAAAWSRSDQSKEICDLLLRLQRRLFDLGADLGAPRNSSQAAPVQRIRSADSTWLEKQIDLAAAQLPPLKQFILPGGSGLAAHLHLARTICRRAERRLIALMEKEDVGPEALVYLNRLGDLLFMLARLANHRQGVGDTPWSGGVKPDPPGAEI